jgi:hypothetical protein
VSTSTSIVASEAEAGLLNKGSCLAYGFGSHFVVILKSDLGVQQTHLWFVEHLSQTKVAQQSVTKIISLIFINLVTPKVGAKHELFSTNRPLRPVC